MSEKNRYLSQNREDTIAYAKKLGESLVGGEVIAFYGDLGTGKTTFVQGLAQGLGVKEMVNSPTFVIMKLYDLKNEKIKKFCHIDTYRLNNSQELDDLGVEEYWQENNTVSAVEWAEKVEDMLPQNCIRIRLKSLGEKKREIIIE